MIALWRWVRRREARGPLAAAADEEIVRRADRLFWQWAVHVGVVVFAAGWLHRRGLWQRVVDADPSGISVGIALLCAVVTAWCGWRALEMVRQALPASAWRSGYLAARHKDPTLAPQLLADRTHGPHETAWWFVGATLKLGLLGTVVGFIVMASQIAQTQSFELDQIQLLLKQMTGGMAIALYTTLVGLVGNLWLGLQLMLLDRLGDRLAADILAGRRDAG